MTRAQTEQKRQVYQAGKESRRVRDLARTNQLRAKLKDLHHRLAEVTDYRTRLPFHPLRDVLSAVVGGLLVGENQILHIETLLDDNKDRINTLFGRDILHGGISDSTMLRALYHTDWMELLTVICEWSYANFPVSGPEHYAIDGKAVRAALKKCFGGTHPPYILNACSASYGCLRVQIQVGEKTNELGEFTHLFRLMPLDGACITIDAAGTNAAVADSIIKAGGHFILPVKGNQSNLQERIEDFFRITESEHPGFVLHYESDDNGILQHGRIEYRFHDVITEGVEELMKGTSFEGLVHSVGRVTRSRTIVKYDVEGRRIPGDTETQTLYYIQDIKNLRPERFAKYIRDHWAGCEMIHYVLDCEFDEDLSTINTGNGMQNMSLLRKAVHALITWIRKLDPKIGSYHIVRMRLRSLWGIPVLSDVEVVSDPAPE